MNLIIKLTNTDDGLILMLMTEDMARELMKQEESKLVIEGYKLVISNECINSY